jgi:hypothetical protein
MGLEGGLGQQRKLQGLQTKLQDAKKFVVAENGE